MYDDSGALTGAVNMLNYIADSKRAEEQAYRLAAIVTSSHDAIISKDLNGVITSWNFGAERLFGYTEDETVGRPITILIPLDRLDEEPMIMGRIRSGELIDHYETIRQRKDGTLVEVSLTVSPVKDSQGRVIGASKIARDITHRRRDEQRQQLLLKEMDHRIKNLFAVANSIVALSARSASTPKELASHVSGCLAALARSHALTLPGLSEADDIVNSPTTLHAVIRAIVSPYEDQTGGSAQRVLIRGPDVLVGARALTSLALILHEFATNAAKYGALSAPAGYIEIACSQVDERFVLIWSERGGPHVKKSESEGFGTRLGRATVEAQFGGEISREWDHEGLRIRLSLDRASISD